MKQKILINYNISSQRMVRFRCFIQEGPCIIVSAVPSSDSSRIEWPPFLKLTETILIHSAFNVYTN